MVKKIGVLNGLRGLAILLVIFVHTLSNRIQTRFDFHHFIGNGWIGVNLFFILSGFVLYLPYIQGERKFASLNDVKRFYINRFLRLYPLFFFTNLISLIFILHPSIESIKSFLLTLSTLSMFTSDNFFSPINFVIWSLVVEIWFSIIFPFLVVAINKFGLLKVSLVIFILALSIRFLGANYPFYNNHLNPFKDFFLARCDDFMLGIIICFIYIKKNDVINNNSYKYFLLSIFIFFITFILLDKMEIKQLPNYIIPFTNNFIQIAFACLIIPALNSNNLINKIFSFKPLQLLGLMCFSLYLWHSLLLSIILKEFTIFNFLLYLITLFIIALFTYRYIEFRKEENFKKLLIID